MKVKTPQGIGLDAIDKMYRAELTQALKGAKVRLRRNTLPSLVKRFQDSVDAEVGQMFPFIASKMIGTRPNGSGVYTFAPGVQDSWPELSLKYARSKKYLPFFVRKGKLRAYFQRYAGSVVNKFGSVKIVVKTSPTDDEISSGNREVFTQLVARLQFTLFPKIQTSVLESILDEDFYGNAKQVIIDKFPKETGFKLWNRSPDVHRALVQPALFWWATHRIPAAIKRVVARSTKSTGNQI